MLVVGLNGFYPPRRAFELETKRKTTYKGYSSERFWGPWPSLGARPASTRPLGGSECPETAHLGSRTRGGVGGGDSNFPMDPAVNLAGWLPGFPGKQDLGLTVKATETRNLHEEQRAVTRPHATPASQSIWDCLQIKEGWLHAGSIHSSRGYTRTGFAQNTDRAIPYSVSFLLTRNTMRP